MRPCLTHGHWSLAKDFCARMIRYKQRSLIDVASAPPSHTTLTRPLSKFHAHSVEEKQYLAGGLGTTGSLCLNLIEVEQRIVRLLTSLHSLRFAGPRGASIYDTVLKAPWAYGVNHFRTDKPQYAYSLPLAHSQSHW